jgi:hypothetical protein
MSTRQCIGSYHTYDRAADALEEAFACGFVCEGEHPVIVRRANGRYDILITVWL